MKLILPSLLAAAMLTSGCATVISAAVDEPIEPNIGSRTVGGFVSDQLIEEIAAINLKESGEVLKSSNINVLSFNGTALLTGQVPNQATKRDAQEVVSGVRGVKKVENALTVAGATTLGVRANDAYLTAAVKTSVARQGGVGLANRTKVTTEDGTVYLLGFLTQAEIALATDAAQRVSGVERIVTLFEKID